MRLFGDGTTAKRIPGTKIVCCCIAPTHSDCLERAMEEWKKHKAELPKRLGGKRYVPGIYAFAYWLIRWSGIVQPTAAKSPNGAGEPREADHA